MFSLDESDRFLPFLSCTPVGAVCSSTEINAGQIPKEIGNLTLLEKLFLGQNRLTGKRGNHPHVMHTTGPLDQTLSRKGGPIHNRTRLNC